ncbi:hypothetical protein DOTSEDRAFT_63016 [Dothistroma septosporum NZE10]|uniref:Fe2OG dioxygenase domain-containing protein n=1 Tax=Dothistroma septosporum (strain NZE10 / CBS 128990) TaxID=675120 RepID=N1PQM2_DOTSN|nr:hypothetical protein DOTSEDRAFT_63016 [Dothistroma septosporum NZE10]
MPRTTSLTIPTIDVSGLLKQPSSPAARIVIDQVRVARETTGFFHIEGAFLAAREFFALLMDEKRKLDAKHNAGHRGNDLLDSQSYEEGVLPALEEVSNRECIIGRTDQVRPFFMGPNVWSQNLDPAELQQPVEAYYLSLYALSRRVLDMMAHALPYDVKELFGRFTDPDLVAPRLRLTGSWMQVPPSKDADIVHVGDMLQMWTRGRFKSSVHRVINGEKKDRYSIVFFLDGILHCPLTPLNQNDRVSGLEVPTVERHMLKRMRRSYGKEKK